MIDAEVASDGNQWHENGEAKDDSQYNQFVLQG